MLKYIAIICKILPQTALVTSQQRSYSRKMIKLFEAKDHAKDYSKYRPVYPKEVLEYVFEYLHEKTNSRDYALDLGCGSGQSTIALSGHFKEVLGLDVSKAQIDNAPLDTPNVRFQVGSGEDLAFCEDGTVDLITVAQSLHWMDRPKLYNEVKRVLKPDAVFTAYGYGNMYLDNEKASNIISEEVKINIDVNIL